MISQAVYQTEDRPKVADLTVLFAIVVTRPPLAGRRSQ